MTDAVAELKAQPKFPPVATPASERDVRVDVMRGLALLMIFLDHIPDNKASLFTLHQFGFSDAGEVFVLLAGFASMLAYGRGMDRDAATGLRRVGKRVGMIYGVHVGLLLATLAIVRIWSGIYGVTPRAVAPILSSPVNGLVQAMTLQALPTYLDILPLYIVLLAIFPLIWLGVRRSPALTLAISGCIWLAVQFHPAIDLPNVLDDTKGWYFNPFAWQLLFVLGGMLALITQRHNGALPRHKALQAAAIAYLGVAFVTSAPWSDWGLPALMPLHIANPDKSTLAWPRIIDITALTYLTLSSDWARRAAQSWVLRGANACGRHSLLIFALGCTLAIFGRLVFRTFGEGLGIQAVVDVIGMSIMVAAGLALEVRRTRQVRRTVPLVAAGA
jgi:hypothetical protein